MALCTSGALSTSPLPLSSSRRFLPNTSHLRFSIQKLSDFSGGVSSYPDTRRSRLLLRASSDDTGSNFTEKKSDGAFATIEDDSPPSTFVDNDITLGNASPVSVNDEVEFFSDDDDTLQPVKELFNKLDIDLDVEDSPTILLYGGGAVVALWLLSAIVGAIDSIPVLPKLLEVVGLGYSVWFTTRYLLFKKNREELGSKIEELKQEILGTSDK
ncbi:protein CURVATURE THYLAKOID 1D, chloroplastic-like isoform X1 [Chenopodium quinoa]|uniref:Cyanobacterial aminoacyl-tRNA synthetase CAAD domain-containing protein n=1 Tax=Chenopodium quinoa TaxID=63459 RepID=A0A803KW79_CHEQI|nr:protein CURVATURE THYLAKOID 1D, chloroplastic-like isoform X1 [Chenopodium quinoa]